MLEEGALTTNIIFDDDGSVDPFVVMDNLNPQQEFSIVARPVDTTKHQSGTVDADTMLQDQAVLFDDNNVLDPLDVLPGDMSIGDGVNTDSIFSDLGQPADGDMFDVAGLFEDAGRHVAGEYMTAEAGPFKGKFFVGYLGITPLVLYKENIDTLMSIIKTYTNIPMLNKLIFNMEGSEEFPAVEITAVEGFIPHMNKAFNYHLSEQLWNEDEMTLATEIRQTVLNNWQRIRQYAGLANMCRASNIEISPVIDNIIKRHVSGSSLGMDSFNIVKILTASEDPRKATESVSKRLITAIATEPDKGFIGSIISSYQLMTEQKSASAVPTASDREYMDELFGESGQEIESHEMGVDTQMLASLQMEFGSQLTTLMYLDKDHKISGGLVTNVGSKDYFSSSYEYSQMEYKVLEDLGFPVVIAGNEHQLKRKLTNPSHLNKELHAIFNNLTYIGMITTKGELLEQQFRYQMPDTLVMF